VKALINEIGALEFTFELSLESEFLSSGRDRAGMLKHRGKKEGRASHP
jgi:hypothetical protein